MNTSLIAAGLDQAVALVSSVSPEQLELPTPCTEWNVRQLTDHLVNSAAQIAVMARGEQPDWGSLDDHHSDPATALRRVGDEILAAFEAGSEAPEGMVAAELSVHSWDLATALGRDSGELDQALAEAGYAFVHSELTDDRRGDAFSPAQPAPEDANAYERLAAYAGRTVRS